MAAGPRKAKRRGAPATGKQSASTKSVRSPPRRYKSQARPNAPVKEASQKPARGRRTAAGLPAAGQIDPVLAAQLEAIAHGLEQIADIRAEMEEMRAVIEELAQNVAALVANNSEQERAAEPPEPAVIEEVLIIENVDDPGDDDEGSEPPGFEPD